MNDATRPRKWRIWLGLIALVVISMGVPYVIWRHSVSSAIDAEIAAIRKVGRPTDPNELTAWYHRVEDGGAAGHYLRAKSLLVMPEDLFTGDQAHHLDHLPLLGELDDANHPTPTDPIPPRSMEAMRVWVQANARGLAELK